MGSVSHPSIHRLISGTSTSAKMGHEVGEGRVGPCWPLCRPQSHHCEELRRLHTGETLRTCPRCWCRPLPQKGHQQNEQEEGCQAIQDQGFRQDCQLQPHDANPVLSYLNLDKALINKESIKDPLKRKKARFAVRTKFEERYKTGKNRWFLSKLRF